jgi:uncharacterized protein YbaR (Trm112 family)
VILDHVGNVLTHGLPDEIREWSLEGEQRKKKKKEDKEKPIQVKQCEKCYAIHEPAPICPVCGHIYEVKENAPQQVDGELRELSADDRLRLKKAKITEQARAQSLEELERIASQRGYKPGWARHIWASRQNKQTS